MNIRYLFWFIKIIHRITANKISGEICFHTVLQVDKKINRSTAFRLLSSIKCFSPINIFYFSNNQSIQLPLLLSNHLFLSCKDLSPLNTNQTLLLSH